MSENNTDEIALLFVLFSVKLCKLKKDIRYLVKWQYDRCEKFFVS